MSLAIAAAAIACGSTSAAPSSGQGGPNNVLDCAWASGANCWKSTVAAAQSCLPSNDPNPVPGTLSSDLATCTYASGQTIALARPLVQHGQPLLPSFDVTTAGAPCLKYEELSNGVAITTAAGTLTFTENSTLTTLTIGCPDGSTFSGALASLSACEDVSPGIGQGTGYFINDAGTFNGSYSVTLDGTETRTTTVFVCATR